MKMVVVGCYVVKQVCIVKTYCTHIYYDNYILKRVHVLTHQSILRFGMYTYYYYYVSEHFVSTPPTHNESNNSDDSDYGWMLEIQNSLEGML